MIFLWLVFHIPAFQVCQCRAFADNKADAEGHGYYNPAPLTGATSYFSIQ